MRFVTCALALGLAVRSASGADLPPPDPVAAEAAFAEALAAREASDLATYRAKLERAAELLPDNARLLYRLAGARLLDGDAAGALEALRSQVEAGLFRDPRNDPEFAPLASDPAFVELLARLDGLRTPIVASSDGFRLNKPDLLVEGIAFHPASGSFLLSSVRQGKILRRSRSGRWDEVAGFDAAAAGAPLGLAVDASRNRLWVASTGLPHGGASKDLLKRGGAFALELGGAKRPATGKLLDAGHSANDLALTADGTVFVSDPEGRSVIRLGYDGSVRVLGAGAGLRSPGGLALSGDGRRLYVADWSNGLAAIDLTSGSLSWLRPPVGSTVLGIDGLVRHGDSLIAIQNGVYPPRISRFRLSPDGSALASAEVLERAVPFWDEPTLGVVVDDTLWYVAASQWPRYAEDGKPAVDLANLPPASVRRLRLR